jgi:hypothetical protein
MTPQLQPSTVVPLAQKGLVPGDYCESSISSTLKDLLSMDYCARGPIAGLSLLNKQGSHRPTTTIAQFKFTQRTAVQSNVSAATTRRKRVSKPELDLDAALSSQISSSKKVVTKPL